jgi:hypothetical protein
VTSFGGSPRGNAHSPVGVPYHDRLVHLADGAFVLAKGVGTEMREIGRTAGLV